MSGPLLSCVGEPVKRNVGLLQSPWLPTRDSLPQSQSKEDMNDTAFLNISCRLVLSLSGTTSPQQNLVLHNDRNDTCRLFKALGE